MFLYRRQGPKKRPKPGTPRKGRNPQKGLPNSARDLLPIIQPATKALAQMLAGRSAASGQLGHARAVLAQTEKLVAERAHNRLNPVEREEFFEQVARLKLTLSDAESEAEFQAAEERAPSPIPVPVDRERLKAMALSLTSSSAKAAADAASRRPADTDEATENPGNGQGSALDKDAASAAVTKPETDALTSPTDVNKAQLEASSASAKRVNDPAQLRLPRETADKLSLQSSAVGIDGAVRRRKPKLSTSPRSKASASSAAKSEVKTADTNDAKSSAETLGATKVKSDQKLPKGWIIDDEGFVVPGPS